MDVCFCRTAWVAVRLCGLFSMSSCPSTLAANSMPLHTGTSYLVQAVRVVSRLWLWKVDAASERRTRSCRRSVSPMHASCSAACGLRSEVVVWAGTDVHSSLLWRGVAG